MYQNCTSMETALTLQLDFTIPNNHEAHLISRFVDSILSEILLEETSHTDRPASHPAMMLKMCLFTYSRSTFSGRKIEQMNEESIPMKWLMGDTSVCYKTINNFRSSEHASNLIKHSFLLFTILLSTNGFIQKDALYIDVTKLQADAVYGSEENYLNIMDEFEKVLLIPYGMYHKEQSKKYKNNPKHRDNWHYDEVEDSYTDLDRVHFIFSHYSTRNDKNGFQRQFKVYKADTEQTDNHLNQLAKTPKSRQRQTAVNYSWEFFKYRTKENLESETGKDLYAQRKIDLETVFGRLKGVLDMRRVHLRGKQAVLNDIGIMLMSMNLTKLAIEARRRAQAFHNKSTQNENRNETIKK